MRYATVTDRLARPWRREMGGARPRPRAEGRRAATIIELTIGEPDVPTPPR